MHLPFHGSLAPDDGELLLQVLGGEPDYVNVAEKERLIQSGARHYGEMLSEESLPAPAYEALFARALRDEGPRLAADCEALARALAERAEGNELVLVSLARAGTPVGAALARRLRRLGVSTTHYSVSIIRDHGLDPAALAHVAARHDPARVWFVDGWTAKGVIRDELARSLEGTAFTSRLCVLADLAGVADLSASADDALIPSALLNATVSGLVSRTVLTRDGGFHGCHHYAHWAAHDRTAAFIAALAAPAEPAGMTLDLAAAHAAHGVTFAARRDWLARWQGRGHQLKPGIGEASRALLRRRPRALVLRDPAAPAVAHLAWLAGQGGTSVEAEPTLPWAALAVL